MTSSDPPEAYSTLQLTYHELDTHKEATAARPNQFHVEKDPIAISKEWPSSSAAPTAAAAAAPAAAPAGTICGLRRLHFWLVMGFVSVSLIVGAVVGGVLGSRANNSLGDDSRSPPQQTTTATGTSNSTRPSSLAAVYYSDETYATAYRLYVQKGDNWIHEYTRDNHTDGWTHTSRVGLAAADSPIAATVVYDEVDFDLRVYFTSDAYVIQESGTRSMTQNPTRWTTDSRANSLPKMDINVLESSSIAGLWLFQNTTNYYPWVLYQAAESNLTLRGGDGWATEDVPFRRPSPRSPLAMAQSWTRANNLSSLTMFYQQEGGDIVGVWGDDKYGWTDLTVPVPAFSSDENTRIAAFVYNPGGDSPEYMILLVSNNSGVTSYVIWEGQDSWLVEHPAAMSSLDQNTPLAVTENGRAYGISKGVVKEFRFFTDGSWEDVGDVIEL